MPDGFAELEGAEVGWDCAALLIDPAIADRLGISARTVQTHLARVYTKLGINSRTQISRYLDG